MRARGSLRGRNAGFGNFYFILFSFILFYFIYVFAVKRKGESMILRILSLEGGADGTLRSRGCPWEKVQVLAGTRDVSVRRLLSALRCSGTREQRRTREGGRGWAEETSGRKTPGTSQASCWFLLGQLAGRSGDSPSHCPDPTGTKLIFSCSVKRNEGTQVPHRLTFGGVHRMVSFSHPMRSRNILYPLEKKCKS